MDFNEVLLFEKKSLADVFKDIYKNSTKTEKQISELITSLKPFITNAGEAVIIVPLIKEYLEVKVKNDEHLIKLGAIVQRAMQSGPKTVESAGFELSESEKQALLDTVKEMESPKQFELPKQLAEKL